jgi:hypothetical protein
LPTLPHFHIIELFFQGLRAETRNLILYRAFSAVAFNHTFEFVAFSPRQVAAKNGTIIQPKEKWIDSPPRAVNIESNHNHRVNLAKAIRCCEIMARRRACLIQNECPGIANHGRFETVLAAQKKRRTDRRSDEQ